MSYELRTSCCNKDNIDLTANVTTYGKGWRYVDIVFDDILGTYTIDADGGIIEENYVDDETIDSYECCHCGEQFDNAEEGITIVQSDDEGNVRELGRYWCDYCNWTGNFSEDHAESTDCKFTTSGPVDPDERKKWNTSLT